MGGGSLCLIPTRLGEIRRISIHPADPYGWKTDSPRENPARKCAASGYYVVLDFSIRDGCAEKGTTCTKGKREWMSAKGLRYPMLIQLAMRGWRKSIRMINPVKIDGYIQAMGDSATDDEAGKKNLAGGEIRLYGPRGNEQEEWRNLRQQMSKAIPI